MLYKNFKTLFTPESIKVLNYAEAESRRLGHNFVGSEMVFLGILGDESNYVSRFLQSIAINVAQARENVESIVGRGAGFVAVEIPFTPYGKKALELAISYSKGTSPTPEHLMLGLLDIPKSTVFKVFEKLNLDVDWLRSQLIEIVRQDSFKEKQRTQDNGKVESNQNKQTKSVFSQSLQLKVSTSENGIWFASVEYPDSPFSIKVHGNSEREALSQALRELATKIEIEL